MALTKIMISANKVSCLTFKYKYTTKVGYCD